jgi:hypothetical protein
MSVLRLLRRTSAATAAQVGQWRAPTVSLAGRMAATTTAAQSGRHGRGLAKLQHPFIVASKLADLKPAAPRLLPPQLSAWMKLVSTQIMVCDSGGIVYEADLIRYVQVEKQLSYDAFVQGSKRAFLRINELIGQEDVEGLRPLVSDEVLQGIQDIIGKNVKLSNERPSLEILDVLHSIDEVELSRQGGGSQLWIKVDVCYNYSCRMLYHDRKSSKACESVGPAAIEQRYSKLSFSGCLADKGNEDNELTWKIVSIE